MKNTLHSVFIATIGLLALMMVVNLLVHLLFYIVDGHMYKLVSPIWLWLNGITILLCLGFAFGTKRKRLV